MDAVTSGITPEHTPIIKDCAAVVLLSTHYGAEVTLAIPHVSYFPERASAYMHLARDYDRLILVLPDNIPKSAETYLQDTFFTKHEQSVFLNRIEIFVVPNGTTGTLTGHFLNDPIIFKSLMDRIPAGCKLTVINASTYEDDNKLASMLGGTLEEGELKIASKIGTKFGSKTLFSKAGVAQPSWNGSKYFNDKDFTETINDFFKIHKKLCIKIDDRAMAGGIGNFYFSRPSSMTTISRDNLLDCLDGCISPREDFWPMVEKSGCIIEEFIEQRGSYPSALLKVCSDKIEFVSWQKQQIINSHFSGFDLVPDIQLKQMIETTSLRIAGECQRIGYRGSLGIDYIHTENGDIKALEINARKTGVSHVIEFCDGILRKHNRFRESEDVFARYRRGVFAHTQESRSFEANLAKIKEINSEFGADNGNGGYFINIRSLNLNGFVEFICIASNEAEVQMLENQVSKIFDRPGP